MKTLLHLAHEHLAFRIPEVKSIAKIFSIDLEIPDSYNAENPFLVVDLPSRQHAINITKRSVLIKSAVELLVQADNYASFFHKLANIDPSLTDTPSFRIKVESFNKTLAQEDKISIIEKLTTRGVPFKGKVILGNQCHTTYHLLEDYQHNQQHPQHIYFGKWICDGNRDDLHKYDLKKRKFIGNTTMDVTLSMIMANMALCREGTLVYDPFVGTGSLLVSCAHYGSHVMGSEIDFNLVTGVGKSSRCGQKWRQKDESIHNNLQQYSLQHRYVDVFIADASQLHRLWKQPGGGGDGSCDGSGSSGGGDGGSGGGGNLPRPLFDAIITDPPYGIREPTQKVGFKTQPADDFSIDEELRDQHIPCKRSYHLGDLLSDLLTFAAMHLCVGGRVVFWMPVHKQDYTEANVPQHECLQVVANCEQSLNTQVARRMITMTKISHFNECVGHGQASMQSDHYADVSFRHKYFRSPSNHSNNNINNNTNNISNNHNNDNTNNNIISNNENSTNNTIPKTFQ